MDYYGTLGPACGETRILKRMFEAGMTGVRLNLSHGDLERSADWMDMLSEAAGACGVKPKILIDLRGPELRIGRLESEVLIPEGSTVIWSEDGFKVPESFLLAAKPGDHVLVDDGKLELLVEDVESGCKIPKKRQFVRAKALRGGILKSEKSLAIVGKEVPMPTLTESDYKNLAQAAKYGVTGVMLPFVRGKEDLMTLKKALLEAGTPQIQIFAKIENLRGVQIIEEHFPYCDQVVIARGDLGNAMPLWKLPGMQKKLAAKCRKARMPFMVVTQMLDSMHERAVPTRAEVLDIYNAVLDGAASLMLTGETAVGKYPVEAMEYLVKTGEEALRDI